MKNKFIYESFNAFVENELNELNEAFKSSKLRNLINMDQAGSDAYGKSKNLAAALYGLSKIRLDQIEDHALIDMDAMDAFKQYSNNKDYIVFYIIDNEKENPHADSNSYRKPILKPGILGLSRGKDFLDVQYNSRDSRVRKNGSLKYGYTLSASDDGIGGNKKYRGYDASGIGSVARAAKLSDRAIAFNIISGGESAKELIQQRADARSGAIAFKSAAEFKKENIQRYKDILAQKASKLPLDKIVEDTINELTKQIADGLKRGEKTRSGRIKIGESPNGEVVTITDASNLMNNILSDYEKYVVYMSEFEKDPIPGGRYETQAKEYAKSVSDKVKKVKNMDYAW